jgi:polyhydroxyalkanoate synthesis regulator phasin
MAKKKKKDKQKGSDAADAVTAVRTAVERTLQATTEGAAGKRLVDEITNTATRVRQTIDDLKVLDDVRALRAEIEALGRRVAALEIVQRGAAAAAPSRPAPAKRTPAKRTAAKRSPVKRSPATRSTSKPAAKRSRAKAKPRAKRASAGRS